MPLVVVTRDSRVTDDALKSLLGQLRQIVAAGLTVPGTNGELNANEIEVMVQDKGHLDQNIRDISVIIWANTYLGRLENLDERRNIIAKHIKYLLPVGLTGSLWILLQPGSYEEW